MLLFVAVPETVHRQEYLSRQPFWIYQPARNYAAAEVDCSNLVESWNEAPVLCVTRANAPKTGSPHRRRR